MQINSPCYIVIFKNQVLIDKYTNLPLLFTTSQVTNFKQDIAITLFIRTYQSVEYHVVDLRRLEAIDADYDIINLRKLVGRLEDGTWITVNRAMQLLEWYNTHKYCSCCGAKTVHKDNEHSLVCVNCQHSYYPRINPCIMVLIIHGDKVLLVKSSNQNAKHFSLIAGFIEAGESAEEAVHREVLEEVGLQVTNLIYRYSHSWPFPHALMLGFIAEYTGGELSLDPTEISDAGWYCADDLPLLTLPDHGTLSRRLIDDWLQTPPR
jgi:NAD+ diphosphatase